MQIKLKFLFSVCSSVIKLIEWLFSIGLLLNLNGKLCDFCQHGRFCLRKDSSFSSDQCCWRCSNRNCNKKVSIRHGSWFSNSNLTLEKIIFITYFWVYRADQCFVKHELDIQDHTIVDWYNFAREVCIEILERFSEKIGGVNKVVEIDESKFGKRKYHKGRRVDGVWVFGGIERESKRAFFRCVPDRTADTLIDIIKENVLPGTTVYSDCWRAYHSLNREGFHHLTVNHSINFVDPDTGVHTNTIESTWRALKKSLPKNGTVKTLYDSYFAQYCVRKQYLVEAEDPFMKFLDLVKAIYPPEFKPSQEEIDIFNNKKVQKPQKPASTFSTSHPQTSTLKDITNKLNDSLDDFQL